MRPLTKSRAYELLFKINKKQHVEIDHYIDLLSKSGNTIPIEVIVFINKYNSSTLPQLKIFNIVYCKRHKNPLYKTIMNEAATPEEQCLALNSMVTQCLIQLKDMNMNEREEFIDIMNVKDILEGINSYFEGNTKKTRTVFFEIRGIFKNLFGIEEYRNSVNKEYKEILEKDSEDLK